MAEEPKFPLQLSSFPAQVLESPSLIIRTLSSNFLLHKAICFSLVVALLSILPSQATTRSILATAWEILHLLFLGVAISYGLFSRRNADFDAVKETATAVALKADGAVSSYFSNMFQVSSVFEDDDDGDDDEFYYLHGSVDETKSQAWNSQYQRNDPVVVVANESASRRPLFLPVRSLKSHLHDLDSAQEMENVEPLDSTNAQSEIFGMEMEEEECSSKAARGFPSSPPPLSPPSLDGLSNNSKISSFRSSKKKAKPPPAPPPPPAFSCYGFPSTIERKITKQSFKDELKDLSRRVRKSGHINTDIVFDLFESATKPGGSSVPRSCRTIGAKDVNGTLVEDAAPKIDTEKAVIATLADSGNEEEEVKASVKVEKSSQFGGDGNEVDKKADEFIAKFRKQITLQRLEAARHAAN